ncbi:MAG: hypothetical protein C0597_04320 [Marinilabiliales bacterium]|nr:MAG: hypothetical protein C0597_04320 [Marinilabiliales bacterium]
MKTKIKILTTISLVLVTVLSFAQNSESKVPSIEERIKHTMKVIEKKINIEDSQKEVIKNAYNDFFVTVDQILQSGEKPEKEVMELHEKTRDNKIKAILTTEQYEDYLRITCKLRSKPNKEQKRARLPKQN